MCEEPTDFFFTIESFFYALENDYIDAEFVCVQPKSDNTSSEGGWGNVLLWLDRNNPEYRIQNYFGGGLFADPHHKPKEAIPLFMDRALYVVA